MGFKPFVFYERRVKMNEKLLELLDSINKKKKNVKDLAEAGKIEEAKEAKKELQELQDKFDVLKDLDDEALENMKEKAAAGDAKPAGGKDSVKEFADAARKGFRVQNSLSSGIRESSNPDGGYIVPEDIQTRINDWKKAEFSLESLIAVEPVSTKSGKRTYEKKADMTGFQDVEEGGELQEMDTPQFERIAYDVQDRGGWLPMTNDLLADTDQNITARITRWIARKSNATSNAKVLGMIAKQSPTEIEMLDEVKKALIVTLGSAYMNASQILTNDDGLFFLSTLKDNNGRELLQPNPLEAMRMYLCVGPLRVPIVTVPNKVFASDIQTKGKLKIPIVCADFKEAFKKYDRQRTSLLASNIAVAGTLNAFTQNLTLIRAIERNDFQVIDADAYVNLRMVVDDASVSGES